MTTQQYQVAVIGAGPAGLRAAITAAKAGLTTLLIDDQRHRRTNLSRPCPKQGAAPAYLGNSYFAGLRLLKHFHSLMAFIGLKAPSGRLPQTIK